MIAVNQYYSYNTTDLPQGCQFCVKGEKLVLFITGYCPRKCYFCPISDQKYGHDVTFANERSVGEFADIIVEARAMNARGAGITGGDPLMVLERTCSIIKKLKEEFGSDFHIHLYTSLNLATEKSLQALFDAGLDEIRFHLDLDHKTFWKNLKDASHFAWDCGVEIPLIPHKEKETREMVDFIQDKVKFLVLNELERADNNFSQWSLMGMKVKEQYSYAIEGSLALGFQIMQYAEEKKYPLAIHLCTAKLKDKVQLTNRIKREGKLSHKTFDLVDKEGLLTRGALYLPQLKPGFRYRTLLASTDKIPLLAKLETLLTKIKEKWSLKEEDIYLDKAKVRILLSKKLIKKKKVYFRNLGLIPAIVKEYPTADQLELEVDFLH